MQLLIYNVIEEVLDLPEINLLLNQLQLLVSIRCFFLQLLVRLIVSLDILHYWDFLGNLIVEF